MVPFLSRAGRGPPCDMSCSYGRHGFSISRTCVLLQHSHHLAFLPQRMPSTPPGMQRGHILAAFQYGARHCLLSAPRATSCHSQRSCLANGKHVSESESGSKSICLAYATWRDLHA
eukprot:358229-Chlamydomonas_euryale.AAC.17